MILFSLFPKQGKINKAIQYACMNKYTGTGSIYRLFASLFFWIITRNLFSKKAGKHDSNVPIDDWYLTPPHPVLAFLFPLTKRTGPSLSTFCTRNTEHNISRTQACSDLCPFASVSFGLSNKYLIVKIKLNKTFIERLSGLIPHPIPHIYTWYILAFSSIDEWQGSVA